MSDPSRRQFLGAAGALAALPLDSGGDTAEHEVTVESGDHGVTQTSPTAGPEIWGAVNMGEVRDEEASISVSGYHYDDGEEPQVEVMADVKGAQVFLNLSPERAREFAREIETAAVGAANGGDR